MAEKIGDQIVPWQEVWDVLARHYGVSPEEITYVLTPFVGAEDMYSKDEPSRLKHFIVRRKGATAGEMAEL